jgi:hypothetical protein
MWKETIVAHFKALSLSFPWRAEENTKSSANIVDRELGISKTRSEIDKHSAFAFCARK